MLKYLSIGLQESHALLFRPCTNLSALSLWILFTNEATPSNQFLALFVPLFFRTSSSFLENAKIASSVPSSKRCPCIRWHSTYRLQLVAVPRKAYR